MTKTATERVLEAWTRKHGFTAKVWTDEEITTFRERLEEAVKPGVLEDRRARMASWLRSREKYFI